MRVAIAAVRRQSQRALQEESCHRVANRLGPHADEQHLPAAQPRTHAPLEQLVRQAERALPGVGEYPGAGDEQRIDVGRDAQGAQPLTRLVQQPPRDAHGLAQLGAPGRRWPSRPPRCHDAPRRLRARSTRTVAAPRAGAHAHCRWPRRGYIRCQDSGYRSCPRRQLSRGRRRRRLAHGRFTGARVRTRLRSGSQSAEMGSCLLPRASSSRYHSSSTCGAF